MSVYQAGEVSCKRRSGRVCYGQLDQQSKGFSLRRKTSTSAAELRPDHLPLLAPPIHDLGVSVPKRRSPHRALSAPWERTAA
jgi:hypothetical protein